MQVFVSGTWKEAKARPYADVARILGMRIAEAGLDLACGPGTGIARYVIDGYRSAGTRGTVRYYLPERQAMEAVGEDVEPGADEIIQTDLDYPMRNVFQVKQCQGLFVLTGGDGALEEILPALIDYEIPVAILEGAGSAANAINLLLTLYPGWERLVLTSLHVEEILDEWLDRVVNGQHASV